MLTGTKGHTGGLWRMIVCLALVMSGCAMAVISALCAVKIMDQD